LRRRRQGRRGLSLQSGNGFAERKQPLPRHGWLRHDVTPISTLFLLCSYGFQRLPKESTAIFCEFIPAFDSTLENPS
jgi:hypothetical protein